MPQVIPLPSYVSLEGIRHERTRSVRHEPGDGGDLKVHAVLGVLNR